MALLVLPACAGVILLDISTVPEDFSITRMRGGDPYRHFLTSLKFLYYPHARG